MDHQLRQIASRRIDGQSWDQVASAMGGSAEARRKEYQRGLDVIANLLGIDDDAEICTE
jgi:hypothetical protein